MENLSNSTRITESIGTLFTHEKGEQIINSIQMLAGWITGEGTPGWVSVILVTFLILLSSLHVISAWSFCSVVKKCRSIFQKMDGCITPEHLLDLDKYFNGFRKKRKPSFHLGTAWMEFRETTIEPEGETDGLRNTIRPSEFFSREDLGLEQGIWRQFPALFVSVGLLLTFLGLVAALYEVSLLLAGPNVGSAETTEGLKNLLGIASAKFIMSLVGLFCSIIFILVLRYVAWLIDNTLHSFCTVIEDHCIFISEQELLDEMVRQSKEQTDHMKNLTLEMVAQIAKPLREELPETIRQSIAQAMAPAIKDLAVGTNKGIQSMADSVSNNLSDAIRESVQAIHEINEEFVSFTFKLETASKLAEKYAGSVETSVTVVESANEELKLSTLTLADAAGDVQDMVSRIESANQVTFDHVQGASETILEMTEDIKILLDGNQDMTQATLEMMQEVLGAIETSLVELKEILERFDKIDRDLGNAFEKIEDSVESSINEIGKFAQDIDRNFGAALNRLQAVIAQQVPFSPHQKE